MKKLTSLFCAIVLLTSCDNKLFNPEDQLERVKGAVAIQMQYTTKTTSFQTNSDDQTPSARSVPSVSKEKIELKIFQDGTAELYMENIPHDESLFITETVSANDIPEAKYYQMADGIYNVYDNHNKLILSQPMPEFNFIGVLDRIKANVKDIATLPAILSGGVVYYDITPEDHTGGGAFKSGNHPLHNAFDDDSNYQVVRDTYADEYSGLTYTQEIIVNKSNSTMVWASLYDINQGLVSRTSFEYDVIGESPQLISTQDQHFEENEDGEVISSIVITAYENFTISLDL